MPQRRAKPGARWLAGCHSTKVTERAYLCLGCRLLQAATVECAQCGGTTVAPADLVRDLLAYRDLSLAAERDLGLITALLAGGSIAIPILFPFMLVSLGALVVRVPMRRLRARAHAEHRVEPIRVPPPMAAARAIVIAGEVRRFRGGTVQSRWDGAPVIAEEISIESGDGVIVRHAAAAPFFVDADGERVLVRGHVRLIAEPSWTVGGRKIRAGDALPYDLGLPRDLRVRGVARRTRLIETAVASSVIAIGVESFEALPEHASLRDGGQTRVLVGEPGTPVLIACPTPDPTPT
jgi:hypothetical protein